MNTTSEKQIAANRRNALKSTGPRSPKGRAASRRNALKHGILSKQVLVQGQLFRESEGELKALHRRFWEDLQPAGPVEEMLVDQIVTAHWRLRRALKAESGEISLNVGASHQEDTPLPHPELQWMKWSMTGDPALNMMNSALGCSLLQMWVEKLRARIVAEGLLTEDAVQSLAANFRGQQTTLVRDVEALRQELAAEAGETPDDAMRERQKARAITYLGNRLEEYRYWEEHYEEKAAYEDEARADAAVLPSPETLDKILRYETKLERQLYRAMAHLERIQRLRRGEAIPAPIAVQSL
ncbi:MAG: hypothetical protein P4L99_28810 [Chthoniobacter sp.]|nr:hypothetical protein [Chthoniobacter sp.]